jgi:cyclin B
VKQGKNIMKSDYMRTCQSDLSEKMRSILIDWLVDVHLKFKLNHETLFILVNIIDRFLEVQVIKRQQLQLVGISALLIACKYEEIFSPEIKDLVYVTDNAYTREEVLAMEGLILSTLGFNLTAVSPLTFLERYADVSESSAVARNLAKYILEFSLQNFKANMFLPSVRGSAALCLSRRLLGYEKPWPEYLESYSKLSESDMETCLNILAYTLVNADQYKLKAVKSKYSALSFGGVALLNISS